LQTAGGKNPNDSLMELLFLINALRWNTSRTILRN
jgi:phosphoribosylpyrophosphate synthetase